MGVSNLIILDLDRVGNGQGVNVDFLKKVQAEVKMEIYVGGGVRNIEDLSELGRLGVSGVLVATALHTGRISVEELRRENLI